MSAAAAAAAAKSLQLCLTLCDPIRWPKYWSFSFHIGLASEYSVGFLWDWLF